TRDTGGSGLPTGGSGSGTVGGLTASTCRGSNNNPASRTLRLICINDMVTLLLVQFVGIAPGAPGNGRQGAGTIGDSRTNKRRNCITKDTDHGYWSEPHQRGRLAGITQPALSASCPSAAV